MTAADRQRIRERIDQEARDALAKDDLTYRRCAGCGTHHDEQTRGCKRCWERHRQRHRWATDAEYRARSNKQRWLAKVAA